MSVARLWGLVERAMMAALIILFTAMVVVCTAQVVWRYLFHDPLVWSEEMARYIFIWIGYLSAWIAWKYRAHIALDAVVYLKNPTLNVWSNRIVEALVAGFCIYTLFSSFQIISITHSQPSAVLELPMSVVYAGYSAMAILILGDILCRWVTGARSADIPAVVSEI
jgi:TRAP-type transport system small permease protein